VPAGPLGLSLLGYVWAHEIGHVLEGVVRHSGEGILKARWNLYDHALMGAEVLNFPAGGRGNDSEPPAGGQQRKC
jgi:hypothetical protein